MKSRDRASQSPESTSRVRKAKGRNRPRASLACLKCRERKVKCDVQALSERDTCTPCRLLKAQCIVKHDDDRKRHASRDLIETLQGRIQALERMVQSNSTNEQSDSSGSPNSQPDAPGMKSDPILGNPAFCEGTSSEQMNYSRTHEDAASIFPEVLPVSEYGGTQAEAIISPTSPLGYNASGMMSTDSPPFYQDLHGNFNYFTEQIPAMLNNMVAFPMSSTARSIPLGRSFHPIASSPDIRFQNFLNSFGAERDADQPSCSAAGPSSAFPMCEIPQRSASPTGEDVEQLSPDSDGGRLRSLGPTSQLYLASRKALPDNVTSEEPEADSSYRDSELFQKELLNVYWEFQKLSVSVIHKETFLDHFARGARSQYYSDFLLNCLLACSVRLSTRPAIRKLGKEYTRRAKLDIATELEHPTVASLQGFLLLSDYACTVSEHHSGFLYAGIACRLAFDLGLQQDCSDLVKSGYLSKTDATIRQKLFFGCFVYDRLWSICLGRPNFIKMTDFDAPRPKLSDPSFEVQTLAAWVDMTIMMSEITDVFNCPSLVDERAIRRLSEVDARLHSWYKSLPPGVSWRESQESELDPCVFGLHMQFCRIQIILHRISTMTRRKFPQAAFSEEEICQLRGHTIQQSRRAMRDNAVRIAKLLSAYSRRFGVEKIPTVMLDNVYMAATTLISHICKSGDRDETLKENLGWLVLLLDTMQPLQKHYPVTLQMRWTLKEVIEASRLTDFIESPALLQDPLIADTVDHLIQDINFLPSFDLEMEIHNQPGFSKHLFSENPQDSDLSAYQLGRVVPVRPHNPDRHQIGDVSHLHSCSNMEPSYGCMDWTGLLQM